MRVVTNQPYILEEPISYEVGSGRLTIDLLEKIIFSRKVTYTLAPEAREHIQKCRDYLDQKVAKSDVPLYGITTGFGSLCNISVSQEELTALQENLVKSHSCSYGDEVPLSVVKLMMILKAHALSLGHSGVQVATVERIIDMLNHEMYPVVYDKGSLGASGDLAPLAKLFLPLIGEGEVHYKGRITPSKEAYEEAGLERITMQSKEGLALLNGTQFMSAHGVYALILARRAERMALRVAAISLEAFDGLSAPFTHQIHNVRPHAGQSVIAKSMRELLEGSELQKRTQTTGAGSIFIPLHPSGTWCQL